MGLFNVTLDLIAQRKTVEEFFEAYRQLATKADKQLILLNAVQNGDPIVRNEICNFLLDEDVSADVRSKYGHSIIQLLFAQRNHDLKSTIALCKRFVAAGADINAVDENGETALHRMVGLPFADDALILLYDFWFDFPQKCILTKSKWEKSPLDLAQSVPYRTLLVEYMNRALINADR